MSSSPVSPTPFAASSPAASHLIAKAQGELQAKRMDAAERTLAEALVLAPEDPAGNRLMGIIAQVRGGHARALPFLRKALAALPGDAGLHMALGIALFETGDVDSAVASLQHACRLAPSMASAWFNLGKALKLNVQTEQACEALQRALTLDPSHLSARLTLADALASLGRIESAVAQYREILCREPEHAKAWFALANLKTEPLSGDDAARLRGAFERPGTHDDARILLGFALARALEDQGNYGHSFEVLRQANGLQRRHIAWDAAAHRRHVDDIRHAFATPVRAALDADLGREVILVVSMPRTGSTLVEQILASHPEVEGANEIADLPRLVEEESRRRRQPFPGWVRAASPEDWQRLGAEYLARTRRWRGRKPRFVDKNLATWKLAGAALAMLPRIRVVICRRDPVESCFACYRQWFVHDTEFSYDLDEMADYCIDFTRLTRFWLEKFPDRVFDLEYETLVNEPEPTIRRLLEFCGLPFDPACLEFHKTRRTVLSAPSAAQVRQPLQRNTARADRYGDKLDRLRARLRDAGLPVPLRQPPPP